MVGASIRADRGREVAAEPTRIDAANLSRYRSSTRIICRHPNARTPRKCWAKRCSSARTAAPTQSRKSSQRVLDITFRTGSGLAPCDKKVLDIQPNRAMRVVLRGRVRVMSRRVVLTSVAILGALCVAVGARAATPRQTARANRQAAVRAANGLLGDVVLPPGATKISGETASGPLVEPLERLFLAAQVDRHAFWSTDASPSAVIATVQRHLPAGAKLNGSGSGFGPGSSDAFAVYTFPGTDPAALTIRQLVVNAVGSAHSTVVRADGEVQYIAPRAPPSRSPRARGCWTSR